MDDDDLSTRRSRRARKPRAQDDSSDDEVNAANSLTKLASQDDRQTKIQEKNRRAQRKFRERRKQKMEMQEREIQELQDQVRVMQEEKRQLKLRLEIAEHAQAQNASAANRSQRLGSDDVEGYEDYDPIDMSWLPGWPSGSQLLSNEKIRQMNMEDFNGVIGLMMSKVMEAMQQTEAGLAGTEQLTALIMNVNRFWRRCYSVEPVRTREIMMLVHAGRSANSRPTAEDASALMKVIALTPHQEGLISSVWHEYAAKLDQIKQDRDAIARRLLEIGLDPGSEPQNLQAYLQTARLVDKLRESMKFENKIYAASMSAITERILTSTQYVQLVSQRSPVMDLLQFCKTVAMAQADAPSATAAPAAAPLPSRRNPFTASALFASSGEMLAQDNSAVLLDNLWLERIRSGPQGMLVDEPARAAPPRRAAPSPGGSVPDLRRVPLDDASPFVSVSQNGGARSTPSLSFPGSHNSGSHGGGGGGNDALRSTDGMPVPQQQQQQQQEEQQQRGGASRSGRPASAPRAYGGIASNAPPAPSHSAELASLLQQDGRPPTGAFAHGPVHSGGPPAGVPPPVPLHVDQQLGDKEGSHTLEILASTLSPAGHHTMNIDELLNLPPGGAYSHGRAAHSVLSGIDPSLMRSMGLTGLQGGGAAAGSLGMSTATLTHSDLLAELQ